MNARQAKNKAEHLRSCLQVFYQNEVSNKIIVKLNKVQGCAAHAKQNFEFDIVGGGGFTPNLISLAKEIQFVFPTGHITQVRVFDNLTIGIDVAEIGKRGFYGIDLVLK